PDKQSFFAHLCMKAGMNEDCLTEPEVKIYTYQVEAFSEKDFK
ncbi:MAG: AMMECR1 domain-containing protein, partial [Nitrospiraceae bacterium]|nr:AMMECR1 domain-containing protein [Nitrospiraceae bacterium]